MSLGKRLREHIDRVSNQTAVGKACSPPVTPTAIGRWLKKLDNGTITDEMWRSFAVGLRKVGIRPEDYREVKDDRPLILSPDLLPLLDLFAEDQVPALIRLIEAHESHKLLLHLLRARLH